MRMLMFCHYKPRRPQTHHTFVCVSEIMQRLKKKKAAWPCELLILVIPVLIS